jgi:Ca2+-binding EF-hand superfamily protein
MNNTISKEDVVQVTTSLNQTLTEAEITEAINRYPGEQEQDPGATWNLVVEKIMYDLIDER